MNKFLPRNLTRNLIVGSLLFALIPSLALATGDGGSNPVPAPNPELKASCGLDIALVLDSSGSISTSELNQMKNAFKSFTEAFLPGTATLFSVTDFDTSAQVLQSFTDDLGLVHIAINTPVSGGNTNWADGLNKAYSTFDPRAGDDHPNLIVFASDGNPNRPTSATEALKQAITKANEIKNSGTRILALGIGDNLNVNNLKAISSADAVYTSGFDTLGADLAVIATELCGGTITVKKLVDTDNNLSTKEDQVPGVGWTFKIEDSSAKIVSQVTGVDGFTQALEVSQDTYSVTETLQTNFKLLDAECLVNNSPSGSPSELGVTGISVDSNDIISCVFINHENQAPVITLDGPNPHNILVSGGSYDDPGFVASDLEDGNLTGSVVVGGTVDTSTPGTYILTYNVSDSDGLAAAEKTRTVKVNAPPSECADGVDNDGDTLADFPNDPGCVNEEDDDENTPPVITADSSITITLGGTFDPLNHATVNDDEDDPEPALSVGGDLVLTGVVGDYVVTYNAVDTHGAAAQEKTLTVRVRAACSDTFDNDNDNTADLTDPGCHGDADPNNPESYDPNDNDETNPADVCANLDGIQIVVPQGLVLENGNCVPPPSPICSDGLDNDEDGLIDTADPGCHTDNDPENSSSYDPNDSDETNQPPSPTLCEDSNANNLGQPLPCTYDSNDDNGGGGGGGGGGNAPCSNSRDDDGDGLVDSADPGCHSDGNPNNPSSYVPSDNTENDGGQVLGATTIAAPASCFYLRDYMRRDLNNDPQEVLKLQAFLISFDMRDNVSLTGVFDDATFEAVSLFQLKYAEDILEPWGHTDPTGYVYILTLKKINEIYCQRIFPLNEAQINEIAAFKALLESLRARGINPELPSYQDSVGRKDDDSTTTPTLGVLDDESQGLGMVKGLAMAIVANPENMNDLTKSIYGLLVFLIALYVLGNVLKDVFYKNTPSNLRKRFMTKWLVVDIGLALAIVASFVFDWWFILPLFVVLVLSLLWTSLYPEHNSIRASVKSWYLVIAARLRSFSRNAAQSVKEVAKEPVKETVVAKKESPEKIQADKVIVMGPKK